MKWTWVNVMKGKILIMVWQLETFCNIFVTVAILKMFVPYFIKRSYEPRYTSTLLHLVSEMRWHKRIEEDSYRINQAKLNLLLMYWVNMKSRWQEQFASKQREQGQCQEIQYDMTTTRETNSRAGSSLWSLSILTTKTIHPRSWGTVHHTNTISTSYDMDTLWTNFIASNYIYIYMACT